MRFSLGQWKYFGTSQRWWLYNILNVLNATKLFKMVDFDM